MRIIRFSKIPLFSDVKVNLNNNSSIIFSQFNKKHAAFIDYDLNVHQKKNIVSLIHGIYLRPENLFRKNVTICEICQTRYFHSIFHQYKLIQYCPFHKIPLTITNYNQNFLFDKSLHGILFPQDLTERAYTVNIEFFNETKLVWVALLH